MDKIPNGVREDTRHFLKKSKDYVHEKSYGGLPVVWTEKPRSEWKLTTQRNQDGSFSCVKQSSATALEVLYKKTISAATYQLRKNKDSGGMFLQDCGDIDYNKGATLEALAPSQNMNDLALDSIKLPTLTIKSAGYRTFYNHDIEKVAEAIQAYGQCILCFNSNSQEWNMTPVYNGGQTTFGHAICGTDFTSIGGVKTIVCMDSAGQSSSPTGLRLITDDFLNKRCTGAMYYLGVKTSDMLSSTLSVDVWKRFVDLLRSIGVLAKSLGGSIIKAVNN